MSVTAIQQYNITDEERSQPVFSLSVIDFDHACVANESEFIDSFNIIWIKQGLAQYQVDMNHFSLKDETIFFLNPGQIFSIESEQIKQGYRISFDADFYCIETKDSETACNGLLFNNIYELPYIVPSPENIGELEGFLDMMVKEFQQPGAAHKEMIQSYLKLFLIIATRTKKEHTKPSNYHEEDHEILRRLSFLIEKHFRKIHSVKDYAQMLNLSAKSLTKKLHLLHQKAPSDLIKERLILEAKRELIYSEKSVKEIAFDLGFIDPSYFNRFFRKSTGTSPTAFKAHFLQH